MTNETKLKTTDKIVTEHEELYECDKTCDKLWLSKEDHENEISELNNTIEGLRESAEYRENLIESLKNEISELNNAIEGLREEEQSCKRGK